MWFFRNRQANRPAAPVVFRWSGSAVLALPVLLLAGGGCASGPRAEEGTVLGGLGGTAVGAIIGHQSGRTAEGALIGAAVGALAGNTIGGSLDEIEARNRAELEARLGQMAPRGSVTVEDIIAMSQAGVPESVIVSHIQIHGVTHPLSAADLIRLQNAKVSEAVMNAAQRASATPPRPAPPYASGLPPAGVVVEEHYVAPACPFPPPPVVYHHYYRPRPRHIHRRRPRVSVGVGVGFP